MRALAISALAIGVILFALNIAGLFSPLRAPEVDGYRDFAGGVTRDYQGVKEELDRLAREKPQAVDLASRATRLFHDGMAHLLPDDVERKGIDHYRMRVPATENWLLFALSYVKPSTYLDYEFCDWRKAVERGVGRCGQQSLALVSYLSQQGLPTGFVTLGGHVVGTAQIDDGTWYLLDPDYGGVIPFDIAQAELDPPSVLAHYWNSAARENGLHALFAPENRVSYGGVTARYAQACHVEKAAYVLKWLIPLLLVVLSAAAILITNRTKNR